MLDFYSTGHVGLCARYRAQPILVLLAVFAADIIGFPLLLTSLSVSDAAFILVCDNCNERNAHAATILKAIRDYG